MDVSQKIELLSKIYGEMPILPGRYVDYQELLVRYNDELKNDRGKEVTQSDLRSVIAAANLKSKIEPNYVYKGLEFKAIRIVFPTTKVSAYDHLMAFAVFPNDEQTGEIGYNFAIKQLANLALHEDWFYGTYDDGRYQILKNYFQQTFLRLQVEDEEHKNDQTWTPKILFAERNAIFNTGLVDEVYEPIYAVFNKNPNKLDSRKWVFWKFMPYMDKQRQLITRIFGGESKLPLPAHYYDNTSELVYDIKAEIGTINIAHFIDNCYRLPLEFLRENHPQFDYDRIHDKLFYEELAESIKADRRSMTRFKNRFNDAIAYAIKRVHWNFKTAIPIYFPTTRKISLLLPLALVEEDKIDVALALEATNSGTDKRAYIAHTILTLQMAYTDARLITRPDSDWLVAKGIVVKKQQDDAFDEIED